jgi:tetratricopeptide (TPR) repeat protein
MHIEQACLLDPLSLIAAAHAGVVYLHARQYDRAIEHVRNALNIDADFPSFRGILGMAYEFSGRPDEAFAEYLEEFRNSEGAETEQIAAYRQAYVTGGLPAAHRWSARYAEEKAAREHVSPVEIAGYFAHVGERDQAFRWLEEAYEQRDGWLNDIAVDPWFDLLRDDPRFDDLLRRMGLDPAAYPKPGAMPTPPTSAPGVP